MDESTSKACSMCGEVKPLVDFPREKRTKDGRRANCRDCHNARQFSRWLAEREAGREARRAAREAASGGATKVCRLCGATKPILEFYKDVRSDDGRQATCGPCFLERRRRNRQTTPTERAAIRAAMRSRPAKVCSVCGEEKARAEFNSSKRSADGLAFWCKSCQKAWHRDYGRRNREKIIADGREWYEKNRERRLAVGRAWLAANPGYPAEANRRRRTAIAGGIVTAVDLEALWTGACALCSQPIDASLRYPHPMSKSVDHITPISRGGSHTPENVQWAHLSCNQSKGARLP